MTALCIIAAFMAGASIGATAMALVAMAKDGGE